MISYFPLLSSAVVTILDFKMRLGWHHFASIDMRGAGETRVKIAKIQRDINIYLNNPPLNHGEFDDTHWIPRNLRVRSVKGFLSYTTLEKNSGLIVIGWRITATWLKKKLLWKKENQHCRVGTEKSLSTWLVSCSRKVSVDSVQRYDSLQAILVLKDIWKWKNH